MKILEWHPSIGRNTSRCSSVNLACQRSKLGFLPDPREHSAFRYISPRLPDSRSLVSLSFKSFKPYMLIFVYSSSQFSVTSFRLLFLSSLSLFLSTSFEAIIFFFFFFSVIISSGYRTKRGRASKRFDQLGRTYNRRIISEPRPTLVPRGPYVGPRNPRSPAATGTETLLCLPGTIKDEKVKLQLVPSPLSIKRKRAATVLSISVAILSRPGQLVPSTRNVNIFPTHASTIHYRYSLSLSLSLSMKISRWE